MPASDAREIEQLEQIEAAALLRGDVTLLQSLWADDLLVNSTANLIAGKQTLLEVIADGRLRFKSYSRITLRITLGDDSAITTGNERTELTGLTAGTIFVCSYMNVWVRRAAQWQMLGRHVGLISRVPADSIPASGGS